MGSAAKREKIATKDESDGAESHPSCKDNWVTHYRGSIKNVFELSRWLSFSSQEKDNLLKVTQAFHLRIPRYYLSLIKDIHDKNDPIRMQCVPSPQEIIFNETEMIDPLAEERHSVAQCLVHRYPDRALLLVTGKCFMYCRHCTRKRLWREKMQEPTLKDIDKALLYVKGNKQIREVVISGGDPLTLPTEKLDYILSAVAKIPHVEAMRIGTRAPVVMPERIDGPLCNVLSKYTNLWINLQFNHPNEITAQSIRACRKLQSRGIVLSNQSVLLKGINDSSETMLALCRKLQSLRIRPYYLYQCDPVVGASHFRTSVACGIDIVAHMRGFTGGMCIPTFVVDGVDGRGKVPLTPQYLLSSAPDGVKLRNYKGEEFFYHSPEKDADNHGLADKNSAAQDRPSL